MKTNLADNILMDLGSTTIKYFRFDGSGNLSDSGYFPRDYERVVGEQAEAILHDELGYNSKNDIVKICSSANGGLKIGIIGYTERFSAKWAEKSAVNSGANVLWATDIDNIDKVPSETVDIFVIAGGGNKSPIFRQSQWLKIIKNTPIKYESIVFSGNELLHEVVRGLWPKIVCTRNVLGEDLNWQGEDLVETLREAYLSDLVSKKGISNMRAFSSVPIIPTPAVVQKSFKAVLDLRTKFYFSTPLLMLDIGGATTDLFFGGELLPENGDLNPRPPINRHVFTDFGVYTSKDSLLRKLSLSHRLSDFLRALDSSCAESRYLRIRENDIDWIGTDFLAEACFFLALDSCYSDLQGRVNLELDRVACVVVTGGASQLCDAPKLKRIANICGASNAKVVLDDEYQIWLEGMM